MQNRNANVICNPQSELSTLSRITNLTLSLTEVTDAIAAKSESDFIAKLVISKECERHNISVSPLVGANWQPLRGLLG
ncbi:MAG: hypothetical protein A2Z20_05690 [Bdellovibrionales bacterium RBG_16_40_8]|nr:MAG: hypothetical protein A2Z20_05690 [Bdellovibrionales bacterium RBG_16_40_8]